MEAGQDRRAGVDDSGETTSMESGVRAVRAKIDFEARLTSVGQRLPFSDDGETARVQRRDVEIPGSEPARFPISPPGFLGALAMLGSSRRKVGSRQRQIARKARSIRLNFGEWFH